MYIYILILYIFSLLIIGIYIKMYIYLVMIIFVEIWGFVESRICKVEDGCWFMGSFCFFSRGMFDFVSMFYFFSLLFNFVEV